MRKSQSVKHNPVDLGGPGPGNFPWAIHDRRIDARGRHGFPGLRVIVGFAVRAVQIPFSIFIQIFKGIGQCNPFRSRCPAHAAPFIEIRIFHFQYPVVCIERRHCGYGNFRCFKRAVKGDDRGSGVRKIDEIGFLEFYSVPRIRRRGRIVPPTVLRQKFARPLRPHVVYIQLAKITRVSGGNGDIRNEIRLASDLRPAGYCLSGVNHRRFSRICPIDHVISSGTGIGACQRKRCGPAIGPTAQIHDNVPGRGFVQIVGSDVIPGFFQGVPWGRCGQSVIVVAARWGHVEGRAG